MKSVTLETTAGKLPVRRGKVRDVYDLGETLLLVSTDRISAFDWVLPTGIPDKGRVLTELSAYWFDWLDVPHHMLTCQIDDIELSADVDRQQLAGRTMLVRKTEVVPFECVVRGYLSGSAWLEYQSSSSVCGIPLPEGLRESERLPQPIFTPATKAERGEHDQNISFDHMCRQVEPPLAETLRERSIAIYQKGAARAAECGIIVADTKFEFGLSGGEVLLIDEVMTPDSSRFWPADEYEPGRSQRSFDKQFVRDWLLTSGWDRASPPPPLPDEVVAKTREKYIEAAELLMGRKWQ